MPSHILNYTFALTKDNNGPADMHRLDAQKDGYFLSLEFESAEQAGRAAQSLKNVTVNAATCESVINSLAGTSGGLCKARYYICKDRILNFPKPADGPNRAPAVRVWSNGSLVLLESHRVWSPNALESFNTFGAIFDYLELQKKLSQGPHPKTSKTAHIKAQWSK